MVDRRDKLDKEKQRVKEVATVLHGQAAALAEVGSDAEALAIIGQDQSDRLDALLEQTGSLLDSAGLDLPEDSPPSRPVQAELVPTMDTAVTWEVLLRRYDVDRDEVTLDDLILPEVVAEIDARFDAPLARVPWDRWDYTVVFGAALVGIIADWFCAPLGNPLSKKLLSYGTEIHDNEGVYRLFRGFQERLGDSPIAMKFDWVRRLADMDVTHHNLPIDYSGPNFGGQHHRALSPGHDLLRFLSAIWQIKNGQFVGTHFEDNVPIMVIKTISHKGTEYFEREDWFSAAVEYLLHVTADFFTKTSLPIPGSSFLRESSSREVRKFVLNMYKGINPLDPEQPLRKRGNPLGGYNLRHVVGQSVTTGVTHLIVWLYHLLRYRLPGWIARLRGSNVPTEPVPGLKFNEMLAVAHTAVAAVNVGKVVVMNNPLLLNLPQLLMCMKTLAAVSLSNLRRYNLRARYQRNRLYLEDGWTRIEAMVNESAEDVLGLLPADPIVVH